MKVIILARPDLYSAAGGDTVQISNTMTALGTAGVAATVSLDLEPELAGYDIAHLFNLPRPQEPYLQAMHAKRFGIPIVMSTVYWNMAQVNRDCARYHAGKRLLGSLALDEDLKSRLLGVRDRLTRRDPGPALRAQRAVGYRRQQREILDCCDLLLPNSRAEYDQLEADFGGPRPYRVVPNAVDPGFGGETAAAETVDRRPYVLSVGNLAIRKNQLRLIRAVRELGLHLVLVGRYNAVERRHSDLCVNECARNGFEFLGERRQDEIVALYRGATVHALASWVETPGLASLEAGLLGCNIVSTEIGGTREYFQDLAWYCDPASIPSIRDAISAAYRAPRDGSLSDLIRKRYTWKNAADVTITAYREVLRA